MKIWRVITVLVLCLVLAGCISCNLFGGEEEVSEQLVEVVRGDLTVTVSGSGNIKVSDDIRLAFSVGGRVDRIYVGEGDEVNEGDELAKLETDTLELALAQAEVACSQAQVAVTQAEVTLRTAEYNLEQAQAVYALSDERVAIAELQVEVAQQSLELAKQSLALADQSLAQAQKQLGEATITAPFDGIVASVGVDEKDTIFPSTTVIYLIDPGNMELEVQVDEIDIIGVKLGQRTMIELDALSALQLEGKVSSISLVPAIGGGVVVYEVRVDFDVPEGVGLRTGMSATADIIVAERKDVLLVPDRAIKQDSEGNAVVEVSRVGGEREERVVVIGVSDGFQTEILSGLSEGEVVVESRSTSESLGLGLFGQ